MAKMVEFKAIVTPETRKQEVYENIIAKFSRLITAQIQKFNIQKFGLDPEDISQEVKLKIWKILQNEKHIANYSSYIRKIVNSSVIDHLRRLKREEGIFLHEKQKKVSEQQIDYGRELLQSLQEQHLREAIGAAVDTLMESRRTVVKLFLLNLTLEEISICLNWSKDKTRNLLYRGLSDLKRVLKERNIHYENK